MQLAADERFPWKGFRLGISPERMEGKQSRVRLQPEIFFSDAPFSGAYYQLRVDLNEQKWRFTSEQHLVTHFSSLKIISYIFLSIDRGKLLVRTRFPSWGSSPWKFQSTGNFFDSFPSWADRDLPWNFFEAQNGQHATFRLCLQEMISIGSINLFGNRAAKMNFRVIQNR